MTQRTKIIIEIVCREMGVSTEELFKKNGLTPVREAKTMVIGLMNEYKSEPTLEKMGDKIGNLDHTTILHHIEKFEDRMFTDKQFRQKYNIIKQQVASYVVMKDEIIYLNVIVKGKENVLKLTQKEELDIPCHKFSAFEVEHKILCVDYKPGNPKTTPQMVIETAIKAYKRQYNVLQYTVLETPLGIKA